MLVRSVLGEQKYSDFELMIEFHLVGKIFSPLDNCLTKAYDYRVKTEKSGKEILSSCGTTKLLQQTLDCGYALTDELFKLSEEDGHAERKQSSSIVQQRCPS